MVTRTFTIIKPNAVAAGNTGKIVDRIIGDGFVIRAMKMVFMSRNDADRFYAVHRGKPFFERLVEFMSSGPIVVAVLEREEAIAQLRHLVGATNPAKAEQGTLRHLYGETLTRNAIHAADSELNASIEWNHFFGEQEFMEAPYRQPEIDED